MHIHDIHEKKNGICIIKTTLNTYAHSLIEHKTASDGKLYGQKSIWNKKKKGRTTTATKNSRKLFAFNAQYTYVNLTYTIPHLQISCLFIFICVYAVIAHAESIAINE